MIFILPLFAQEVTQRQPFEGTPSLNVALEFQKSAACPSEIEIVLHLESIDGLLQMPDQVGEDGYLGLQAHFSGDQLPLIAPDFSVINGQISAMTKVRFDNQGQIRGKRIEAEKVWRIHPDFLSKYRGDDSFTLNLQVHGLIPASEAQGACHVSLPRAKGYVQINYKY